MALTNAAKQRAYRERLAQRQAAEENSEALVRARLANANRVVAGIKADVRNTLDGPCDADAYKAALLRTLVALGG